MNDRTKAEQATAAFRPQREDIAVMVTRGRDVRSEVLTVQAARLLHESLGQALRIADCRTRPLAAVPGCGES
jgi:hypothetical protein